MVGNGRGEIAVVAGVQIVCHGRWEVVIEDKGRVEVETTDGEVTAETTLVTTTPGFEE